jgi:hypothetical protein
MINVKKVKLLFNYLLVTSDRFEEDDLKNSVGLVTNTLLKGQIKPLQTVYEVSDLAAKEGFEIGQVVAINVERYGRVKQKKNSLKESYDENYDAVIDYNVPAITIDGVDYLKLGTNDIDYIALEYEDVKITKKAPNLYIHKPIL